MSELKEIKLSKSIARGVRGALQRVNALATAAKSAQELAEAAATVHQHHIYALIEDAGFNPDDFSNYGVIERDGETYLRAKE